jgi:hypothetical protein
MLLRILLNVLDKVSDQRYKLLRIKETTVVIISRADYYFYFSKWSGMLLR